MTKGRLFYLIGASGAGKDSLMRYARQRLHGQNGVIFAHRYITRAPAAGGENHIALSEEEFAQRLQAGCFALHWDSHGWRYAIGIEIDQWRALGLTVVVNGSRAYLDHARQRYPDLQPILIQASPRQLRERLLARSRETELQIEERLRRAAELDKTLRHRPGLMTIANDGPLVEAGERLVAMLTAQPHSA